VSVWYQRQTVIREQGDLSNQALVIARAVRRQELKTLVLADHYRETPQYERLSGYLDTYANTVGLDRAQCLMPRSGQIVRVPEIPGDSSVPVPADELFARFRSDDPASRQVVGGRATGRLTAAAPIWDPGSGDLLGVIHVERSLGKHPSPSSGRVGLWLGTFALVFLLLAAWGLTSGWGNAIRGEVWRHQAALACAAIGMAVTIVAAWLLDDAQRHARSARFHALAETHAAAVADEFRHIALELENLSLLFRGSEHVDHVEFRACTEPLVENHATPGWAWIATVPAASAADFERQMQRDGLDGWTIWQRDSSGNRIPAEGREVLFPMTYLEPATAIGRGAGFDVGSDPIRRAAIEQSLRTAMPTATPPVTLVTFAEPTLGIILFQPAASKKQQGFVSTTLRLGHVIRPPQSARSRPGAGLAGGLFLLQRDQPPQFVASSDPDHAGGPQCLTGHDFDLMVRCPVFAWGRTFLVAVHPQPQWLAANRSWGGWAIALTGTVLTLLLTALVGTWANRRTWLEHEVDQRTAELREAQRIARLGHWRWDLRSDRLDWSASAIEVLECEPSEVASSPAAMLQRIPAEDRERVEQAWRESSDRRTVVELEHRIVARDGRIKWVCETVRTEFDAADRPIRRVGVIQDITGRKDSELRRDLLARVLMLLNQEQDLRTFVAKFIQQIRANLGFQAVAVRLRAGEDFPYYLADGYRTGFIEPGQNLCERGRITAAAGIGAHQETGECLCGELLRERCDPTRPGCTSRGSFWSNGADADGLPAARTPNPALPRLACNAEGYQSVALIPLRSGEELTGLLQVHDRRPGMLTVEVVEFLENLGSVVGIELARRAANEQLQKAHAETRQMLGHAERMRQILLGLLEDQKVTADERDLLQAKLLQSQKMESIGRLAGGIAHDFNNMLQAILGYAEMAIERLGPAHPVHADLIEIEKAARRSADLTRQLLAFARKQLVTPKVLDLNEAVAGILKILQRLIGEDIHLIWTPGRDLWPVRIDPSQVDQILANLAVNARDAIAGIGTLTVATENVDASATTCPDQPDFATGPCVLLTVRDSGCGMDEETRQHVFEPFFTTKGLGSGTGLGLATVFGIVGQNHGCICVDSQPGQGTTFRIYLPQAAGEATVPLVGSPI
jgi:PAS domain S-box-containing protein